MGNNTPKEIKNSTVESGSLDLDLLENKAKHDNEMKTFSITTESNQKFGKYTITNRNLYIAYASLILYLFDIGSDVFVGIQYGVRDREYIFCAITLILVFLPSIILNYFFGRYTIEQLAKRGTTKFTIIYIVSTAFCLTPTIQHILNIRILKSYFRTNDETVKSELYQKFMLGNDLTSCLKLWESFLEAIPQICLQFYIIFRILDRNETTFDLLIWQALSVSTSSAGIFVISFSWFRANRLARGWYATLSGAALHSVARTIPLICHLICISASISVLPYATFPILLVHYIFGAVWYYFRLSKQIKKVSLWTALLTFTPYCFTVTQCAIQNIAIEIVDITMLLIWAFLSKHSKFDIIIMSTVIVIIDIIFRIVHVFQIKYENKFLIKNADNDDKTEDFKPFDYFNRNI